MTILEPTPYETAMELGARVGLMALAVGRAVIGYVFSQLEPSDFMREHTTEDFIPPGEEDLDWLDTL